MEKSIPVHLICGFLGAGKTTLMRNILTGQPAEERIVIVINEYGELGIDGRLLEGFASEVRELTTGCICCTLQADLVYTLFDVYEQFHPDRILIEASGVAEVDGMQKAVRRVGLTTPLHPGPVTTVVDAEMFARRGILGKSYFNPIQKADLILLNKVDLVRPEEVAADFRSLAELNPAARILPVRHCAVARDMFLAPGRKVFPLADDLHEHRHEEADDFTAFSFESESTLDPTALKRWLKGLPWELFRIKGYVRLPDGCHFLNYTYRRPEFTPVDDGGRTRLAFVGWRIDPEEVLSGLRDCLVPGACLD